MSIDSKSGNGHKRRAKAHRFSKVIAFGYEDGPTGGIVLSADGLTTYRFELLATDVDGAHDYEAWDRGEELRVFALSLLRADAFERVTAILSQIERPNWPTWLPGVTRASSAFDALFTSEVEPILRDSAGQKFVNITSSLLASPVEVHRLQGRERPENWFSLLGPETSSVAS